MLSSSFILFFVIAYFILLLVVAYRTSLNSDNDSFFIGNKKSSWLLVAFGMIGTSLSGVTFISVPGTVGKAGFNYFQIVIGYMLGYAVVAMALLPLYYRMNLTSIYTYLQNRFGNTTYRTGASFFILSRTLGATGRLFLVINVLQLFVFNAVGIGFSTTTFIILLMILLYTIQGGVKTIVWTDTLQTSFMLLGLVTCVVYILYSLPFGFGEAMSQMSNAGYLKLFNTDPKSGGFFIKAILGGAFTTITMTGMDQEMMQKNISVKNLGDSQKNMLSFSIVLVIVNLLFLLLGASLYLYASQHQLDLKGDDLFPTIALQHLPPYIAIIFIIGLISALFPSADGALTALTSSTCIDLLRFKEREDINENTKKLIRILVHLLFTVLFFALVMVFKDINNKSIIDLILKIASFTYGPLLGMFAFGLLTNFSIKDKLSPYVCIVSPILCFILDKYDEVWFGGYAFGLELLLLNGLITFVGLWIIRLVKQNKT